MRLRVGWTGLVSSVVVMVFGEGSLRGGFKDFPTIIPPVQKKRAQMGLFL